jgi:hypothetical protein
MKKISIYTISLLFVLSFGFLYAQEDIQEDYAYISFFYGHVDVDVTPDNNIDDFEVAKLHMKLDSGTIINTGENALCEITMPDGSTIRIYKYAVFQVEELSIKIHTDKKWQKIKLLIEKIRSKVLKPISNDLEFDIVSGTALAGVRG